MGKGSVSARIMAACLSIVLILGGATRSAQAVEPLGGGFWMANIVVQNGEAFLVLVKGGGIANGQVLPMLKEVYALGPAIAEAQATAAATASSAEASVVATGGGAAVGGGGAAGGGLVISGAVATGIIVVFTVVAFSVMMETEKRISGADSWAWNEPYFASAISGDDGSPGPNPAHVTVDCASVNGDVAGECKIELDDVKVQEGWFYDVYCADVWNDTSSPFLQQCNGYLANCISKSTVNCVAAGLSGATTNAVPENLEIKIQWCDGQQTSADTLPTSLNCGTSYMPPPPEPVDLCAGVDCDDGNPRSYDGCSGGICYHMPMSGCPDGYNMDWNTFDCLPVYGPPMADPCDGMDCDDGLDYTEDSCSAGVCQHFITVEPIADAPDYSDPAAYCMYMGGC